MYRPEWQPPRSWRNHTPERELDGRSFVGLAKACLALVVAMAPTGIYLWSNNVSVELTTTSSELDSRLQALAEKERALTARVAEAEAPAQLEGWARRQGFVPPSATHVAVWVDPVTGQERIADGSSTQRP